MDYDKLCVTMQPAYTAKQSTKSALIHNQNDILLEFEFSFDTIDQNILLHQHEHSLRICGTTLSWFYYT